MKKTSILAASAAMLGLAACAQVATRVATFEQRAAPAVAAACARFHAAEASPIVQIAVAAGATAATAASGVPVGTIVSSLRSFGTAFCAGGPPPTDVTTPTQQAEWLATEVTAKMLAAVGAR